MENPQPESIEAFIGAAGDAARHQQIIDTAFHLAESATENGTIVQFPDAYRPTPSSGADTAYARRSTE